MTRCTTAFYGLFLLAIAGCGSSSDPGGDDTTPIAQGLLSPISDPTVLEASLKSGLSQQASAAELAAADAAASVAGNFTGTYTQDLNVDELDTVRYDGERLFLSLIHISEPTRQDTRSRMPSSA